MILLIFAFLAYIIYFLLSDNFIWKVIVGAAAWVTIYAWLSQYFPNTKNFITIGGLGISFPAIMSTVLISLAFSKND